MYASKETKKSDSWSKEGEATYEKDLRKTFKIT